MKRETYTNSAQKTIRPRPARNTSGVFAVDRGVFDHPVFADEPFSEREAWLYLVSEAAWKPHRRRLGKFICDLQRGQLAASIRFLADRWRWDRSRVHRFLLRLKREKMIETADETGISVISICNYGTYQRVSLPNETVDETAARQQRDKVEDRETTEAKEESSLRSESSSGQLDIGIKEMSKGRVVPPLLRTGEFALSSQAEPSPDVEKLFDEFWRIYPKRSGGNARKPALEKFKKLVLKDGIDPEKILAGTAAYARAREGEDPKYTAMAETFLNQHRFNDEHKKIEPYHDQSKPSGRPAIEGADQLRAAIAAGYELPPRPEI